MRALLFTLLLATLSFAQTGTDEIVHRMNVGGIFNCLDADGNPTTTHECLWARSNRIVTVAEPGYGDGWEDADGVYIPETYLSSNFATLFSGTTWPCSEECQARDLMMLYTDATYWLEGGRILEKFHVGEIAEGSHNLYGWAIFEQIPEAADYEWMFPDFYTGYQIVDDFFCYGSYEWCETEVANHPAGDWDYTAHQIVHNMNEGSWGGAGAEPNWIWHEELQMHTVVQPGWSDVGDSIESAIIPVADFQTSDFFTTLLQQQQCDADCMARETGLIYTTDVREMTEGRILEVFHLGQKTEGGDQKVIYGWAIFEETETAINYKPFNVDMYTGFQIVLDYFCYGSFEWCEAELPNHPAGQNWEFLEDTEEEPTLNPDYNVDVSFSQKYADIIEEGDDEKSMTTFATLCSFVATMQCHDIRANEDGYLIATLNGPSAQVEAARALLEEGFEYYAYDIKVQAGLPQSTTTRAPAAGTNTSVKDESSEDANMGLVAVFIIVCLLMICILCLTVRNHEEWCGTKKGESGQKTTSV